MASAPMPLDDMRAAHALLSAAFGSMPDDLYIVVGTLSPVSMQSFSAPGAAAQFSAGKADIYVHVGLASQKFAGAARPKAAEIAGLSGLWADIDIADPLHKKQGYPPDTDAALAIVRAMSLMPGLVIHSGHGLHVWWPFAEVWTFDDAEERRRAQILARAWAITLRERAKALGFAIDMVSDISRVLRVPGTTNTKGASRPVLVLEQTGSTISEDDANAVLLDGSWEQAEREIGGRSSTDAVSYGAFVLSPTAEPPFDKFFALMELDPKFKQTWDRKRKDLDGSPSGYDMSFANICVQAGWPDQEIANLMIACRRRHGDDLKLRQDYYGTTIGKARQKYRQEAEAAELLEEIAAVSSATTEDGEPDLEALRRKVSTLLGIEVRRFVQQRSAQPKYRLETDTESIVIGDSASVLSQTKFRAQVFAIARKVLPRFKEKEWEQLARALGELCEIEDIGEEATERGQARIWIGTYLAAHPPLDDVAEAAKKGTAFTQDGTVFIFGHELRKWLVVSEFDRITAQEMGSVLRHFGCSPRRVNVKMRDRWTTKSAWRIPNADTPGEETNNDAPL